MLDSCFNKVLVVKENKKGLFTFFVRLTVLKLKANIVFQSSTCS